MSSRELLPYDERALIRDPDKTPCGAFLTTYDAAGQECHFRCFLSPWHRKGHHRAFGLGPGVVLRWPGNGTMSETRYPDSLDFTPRVER